MYRNHYGNKVLLELMENCTYIPLRDKISAAIAHDKSSKFNNNKWVHLRGNRWTSDVQTNFSSFTEADTYRKKKKWDNDYM